MKESFDNSPGQTTTTKHELCSDKCGTCIENRGCIYDHYLFAAILNMDASKLLKGMNKLAQQSMSEPSLLPNAVAA